MIAQRTIAATAKVSPKVIHNRAQKWNIKSTKINGIPFYDDDDADFLSYKSNNSHLWLPVDDKERVISIHLIDKRLSQGFIARYCGVSMSSVNDILLAFRKDNCITMESKMNRLKY